MVAGINHYGVNAEQYNAYLKKNKKHEKSVNNTKHTIAAVGTAAASIGAGYAVNKFKDTNVIKGIDNALTNGAQYLENGGLKNLYTRAADGVKGFSRTVKAQAPKISINGLPQGMQNKIKNAQNWLKNAAGRVKEFAAPTLNRIKGPLKNGLNFLKNGAQYLLNNFAKLPATLKIGGIISAGAIGLLLLIGANRHYNNGKIDQKYADAAKM